VGGLTLADAYRAATIAHTQRVRYSPQLDGLRGIAILCVLSGHLFESHFRGGWVGVDIFFVLSGFLITSILIAEYESTGTISLKNFYGRRALRLLPALFIGIALTAVLSFFGATPFHTFAGFRDAAVPAVFYFSNFSNADPGTFIHTWSLSVEEQFYLIWPLTLGGVLLVAKPRARIAMIVMLMAAFAAIRFTLEVQHFRWWNLYSWFYTRADVLIAGALVACAAAAWPEKIAGVVRKVKPLALLAILFVGYIFWTTYADQRWLYRWGLTATALCCALILFVVQFDSTNLLTRVLRNKVFVWFGRHSYGIYVYHMQIFYTFRHLIHFGDSKIAVFAATITKVAAVVTISWASYRWIESPLLRLKDKFFSAKAAQTPVRRRPAIITVS
jgi:peptidoglycan/LPS O-acetylase OafA/YrhL